MTKVSTPVQYQLDLSGTRTHKLGVTMQFETSQDGPVDLVMPLLSPGSPTNSLNQPIRISDLRAQDGDGQPLDLEKVGAGRWRLAQQAAGPVSVQYRVRADEFSHVRSYVSERLAYLNGPSALMYVEGHQQDQATVELTGLPRDWQTSACLPAVTDSPNTYYASNYDDLADTNLLAGTFRSVSTEVAGTRLTVNQNGTPPWPEIRVNGATPEQSLEDLKALYQAFLARFGPFPSERYTSNPARPAGVEPGDAYVVTKHYLHNGGVNAGGYEHYHGHELLLGNTSAPSIKRRFDGDGRAYERQIMAHELMHKLLAKFVRHEGIDSSDLSKVGSTDGLWLTEGGVEWAGMALQLEAGLISPQQYLRGLQEQYRRYLQDYAQSPSNAREDSFDAHLGNGRYYNKGAVTASLLDLELRHLSGGQTGLFKVLETLKSEFGGTGGYFTTEDVQRACRAAVPGGSEEISRFFQDYLIDHKPFDFQRILGYAGYTLEQRSDQFADGTLGLDGETGLVCDSSGHTALGPCNRATGPGSLELPDFGLTLSRTGQGQIKLSRVGPGGPAERAGLGDFAGQVAARVRVEVAGQEVSLTDPNSVRGAVTGLRLTFQESDMFDGTTRERSFRLDPEAATLACLQETAATPEQLAVRAAWLGG